MSKNFEFQVTYECNTVCKFCNRLLGVIHVEDSTMTPDQARCACHKLREHDWVPKRVKLSGGEPRMNPHLSEIREIIREELNPHIINTLSNGTPDGHMPETFVTLPAHNWKVNPLPKTNHDPFLISPTDCGMEGLLDIPSCKTRRICGRTVDAYGYSFCPVAPMLGRLLRINPYRNEPWLHDQDHDICRHCPDAIREEPRQELFQIGLSGNYPSKTFKEGLKKYKENPLIFPRMEPTIDELAEAAAASAARKQPAAVEC